MVLPDMANDFNFESVLQNQIPQENLSYHEKTPHLISTYAMHM